MPVQNEMIEELLQNPRESLKLEMKRWINLSEPNGLAKFIKTCFALRNINGGYLLIGLDDNAEATGLRLDRDSLMTMYSADNVQMLISRYASEPFEINVSFSSVGGSTVIVVVVGAGVMYPVHVRASLTASGAQLLSVGSIYVRTLNASGSPSTALVGPRDMRSLIDVCFENREADIGRFVRRHLAGIDFAAVVNSLNIHSKLTPSFRQRATAAALIAEKRRVETVAKRDASVQTLGAWSASFSVYPERESALPDQDFMNKVSNSNPKLTGWAIWSDARYNHNEEDRAKVIDGAWESLIIWNRQIQFSRFHPHGSFYHWQIFPDDLASHKVSPKSVMDPYLMTLLVSEAIIVALNIARGLECAVSSQLAFCFKWEGLAGRRIESWANPEIFIRSGRCYTNSVDAYSEFSLEVSPQAIAPYVKDIMNSLLCNFDGYNISLDFVERCVQKLLSGVF